MLSGDVMSVFGLEPISSWNREHECGFTRSSLCGRYYVGPPTLDYLKSTRCRCRNEPQRIGLPHTKLKRMRMMLNVSLGRADNGWPCQSSTTPQLSIAYRVKSSSPCHPMHGRSEWPTLLEAIGSHGTACWQAIVNSWIRHARSIRRPR